jgi:hypothetical protein
MILTYPSVADFIFTFSPFSSLADYIPGQQVGGSVVPLFGHCYWYSIGSIYPLKSMILTYPSVAEIPTKKFS